MFFLSEEERRLVLRRLLPASRRSEVHPELRGWSWSEPPLAPVYEVPLGVAEVANRYCSTARDVFLRRVVGEKAAPSFAMVEGQVLHRTVAEQLVRALRILYTTEVDRAIDTLELLRAGPMELVESTGLAGEARAGLERKVAAVAEFEYHRIVARVAEVLARQPRVGPCGLAALALPVTLEMPLDGRFLGLSSHLSTDAVSLFEPMVTDLKFGPRRDFHRLATTGYALVMESLHEFPINLGCVTYVRIEGGRIGLERDFHLIDDELRQWFVEARDETMRMVCEERDPGLASPCHETCPWWGRCRGE